MMAAIPGGTVRSSISPWNGACGMVCDMMMRLTPSGPAMLTLPVVIFVELLNPAAWFRRLGFACHSQGKGQSDRGPKHQC